MPAIVFLIALFTLTNQLHANDHIVALTILAEARGEGEDGMAAVACVISQRANERGMTPEAVCLQRKQFSCWNGKTVDDLATLLDCSQAKYALWLEKNINKLNRANIGNANHYHANYIKAPYWARGQTPVAIIGRHLFYRL